MSVSISRKSAIFTILFPPTFIPRINPIKVTSNHQSAANLADTPIIVAPACKVPKHFFKKLLRLLGGYALDQIPPQGSKEPPAGVRMEFKLILISQPIALASRTLGHKDISVPRVCANQ